MAKCKNCGKTMPISKAWCFGEGGHTGSWREPPKKYPSGLFCSAECAHAVDPFAPVHQCGFVDGCLIAIVTAPFKLVWWAIKKCGALCWWTTKKAGRLFWKIVKNKWTWTIFTCGMSWAAWKMLSAIYAPKE